MEYFSFTAIVTSLSLWASLAVAYFRRRRGPRPIRLPIFLALAGATFLLLLEEALLNGPYPTAGLALALVAALSLPFAGSITRFSEGSRYAVQVSGLMFATRLAFIPFPQRLIKVDTTVSVYAVIMALIIGFLFLKKIDLQKVGLMVGTYPLHSQITMGLPLGLTSGIIEYYVLRPSPISPTADKLQALLYVVIVMTLFVGLSEEILFRGLIQEAYQNVLPASSAIIMASIQFGLMHYGWLNHLEILFAFGVGLMVGYMFWVTKSLIAPVIVHALGNIVMFYLAANPGSFVAMLMVAPWLWIAPFISWLLTRSKGSRGKAQIHSPK